MTENREQSIELEASATQEAEKLKQRPIRELLIGGIGFIVFLTVMVVGINAIGVESLQTFISDAGPWAPLIYITIKAMTYIFAPLTSGPIQVVAGTLFGNLWLGVLYTLIGEVLGGSISFLIARRFGRPMIARFVGEAGMKQIDDFYQRRMGGWLSLAVARVLLFSVWDFLSYAAGLAESVRLRTYILVSFFCGAIPTIFFVWIGNSAFDNPRNLLFIYGLVAVMILLPVLLRKQIERILDWATTQDEALEDDA